MNDIDEAIECVYAYEDEERPSAKELADMELEGLVSAARKRQPFLPCYPALMGDIYDEIEHLSFRMFRHYLSRFADGDLVGYTNHAQDCVIARYLRLVTGIPAVDLRIGITHASLGRPNEFSRAKLPAWAACVSALTSCGYRIIHSYAYLPISAGWLRRQLEIMTGEDYDPEK